MSGEKTEEPTDKKLEDAKKKGQTPHSPDMNAAAGLLAMAVCLSAAASQGYAHLSQVFAIVQERGMLAGSTPEAIALALDMLKEAALAVLPFLAASVLTGFVAAFAQVGVNVTFEPLLPNFDKVNPASGLQKLVSIRSIVDFVKMVLKAALLGSVAYVICKDLMPLLVGASLLQPEGVAAIGWEAMLKLLKAGVIVFIVLGPVDWAVQKWLFIRDQRMTKDEVKREHKESEGDPQMKGQRKQIAQEAANEAPARTAVPGSSVVVANPTHYAVALRYVPGETPLPIVTARGVDDQALEIRAIAQESRVPVAVNPPLARQLYKLPVGSAIPEALFESVAAVLRWVRNVDALSRQLTQDTGDDDAAAPPPGDKP
jgi:type III secretion protein U